MSNLIDNIQCEFIQTFSLADDHARLYIKVGHLLSEFWCRICGLEFSDSLLISLLSKIRHRKLCIGIVVSNVDRIPVPTVDDQPYFLEM